jgi:hypothetical protein
MSDRNGKVPDDYDGFDYFVRERQSDLKRIAHHTRGEYQFDDVKSEAWIMAQEMYATKNISIKFSDPEYQELLLAYVYQALVRYTETQVRHAIRLDHGSTDDDEDVQLHEPLIARDQLALIAEWHQVRFAHQADFEPELAGLDHRRKDASGIGLGQFRIHAERGQCNAHHAIRTQVLGQCAGNFAFELLQHGRERHHVGLHALAGLLDVA